MKMRQWIQAAAATWITLILCGAITELAKADPTVQNATSQFVYGDPLPDVPKLAVKGAYRVGVQTVFLTNKNHIDIAHATPQNPSPHYDRPIVLEVWYPAVLSVRHNKQVVYTDCLSPRPDRATPVVYSFRGRALRDAALDISGGPYPLVVVSHGYPGSRVMMSYLTENLASKGYIVAAIDHADSTHFDKGPFASTLLNRWSDITFTIDQFEAASGGVNGSLRFIGKNVDVQKTAVIGYSMGGYGALNIGGAGYSANVQSFVNGNLSDRLEGTKTLSADKRVKAIVAFAPWGGNAGVWNSAGLAELAVPTLFVDGDHDDVAGYDPGVKTLFQEAVSTERFLLVYENARHNIAPNPPPQLAGMDGRDYLGYGEPAWNSAWINNVNQHFVTAFLDTYVAGRDKSAYLNIPERGDQGNWKGFVARTSVGLEFYHLAAGPNPGKAQ